MNVKDVEQFVFSEYEPVSAKMIAKSLILLLALAVIGVIVGSFLGIFHISLIVWSVIVVAFFRYTYHFERRKTQYLQKDIVFNGIANSVTALSLFGIIVKLQIYFNYPFAFAVVVVLALSVNVINIIVAKSKKFYLRDKIVKLKRSMPTKRIWAIEGLLFISLAASHRWIRDVVPQSIIHIFVFGILTIVCLWLSLGGGTSFHKVYLIRKYCPNLAGCCDEKTKKLESLSSQFNYGKKNNHSED